MRAGAGDSVDVAAPRLPCQLNHRCSRSRRLSRESSVGPAVASRLTIAAAWSSCHGSNAFLVRRASLRTSCIAFCSNTERRVLFSTIEADALAQKGQRCGQHCPYAAGFGNKRPVLIRRVGHRGGPTLTHQRASSPLQLAAGGPPAQGAPRPPASPLTRSGPRDARARSPRASDGGVGRRQAQTAVVRRVDTPQQPQLGPAHRLGAPTGRARACLGRRRVRSARARSDAQFVRGRSVIRLVRFFA